MSQITRKVPQMGQKGNRYQSVFLKQAHVNPDSRSQSLPDGFADENVETSNLNLTQNIEPVEKDAVQEIPNELWFKTWPERCDKLKTVDSQNGVDSNSVSESTNTQKTPNGVKNKLTFNEALQNISLAYSPITKQLHLVDKSRGVDTSKTYEDHDNKLETKGSDEVDFVKKGHRRIQAGSFSSTISSLSGLSDPSTSGSLLDADERSLCSFDDSISNNKKKGFSTFFTRNVFSWKTSDNANSSVWKLFSKTNNENLPKSPIHEVASSTALIQHKRPSNLPAKDQSEEERHRNEYKAMLAAAKKKEAQNTVAKRKMQKQQLQLEEQVAAATKHFVNTVLPNWETMRKTKKTQEMWWQGLPSSVRGKIWRLAIGNELNITQQLYEICVARAQNRLKSSEAICNDYQLENGQDQESSMDVIQLDISRTFPNLCIFQEGGPYSEVLHSLLAAYVCYRPDVGYVQGMSYIAAILILNMEKYDAFICFANLLNQPLHLSAFTLNQSQMEAYYSSYNELFNYNMPKLYGHFEIAGLTPDLYLLDWIYTIFAKAMPLDVACRIWDVYLRDGCEFVFRTALGILHLNQDVLMHMDFLHGAQFLTRLPDDLSADLLFKSIQTIQTSIGKRTFSQIVDKFSLSKSSESFS